MTASAARRAVLLAACLAAACGRNQVAERQATAGSGPIATGTDGDTLDWRVGWLDGQCLSIGNDALEAGAPVTIVTLDSGVPYVQGRIRERTESAEGCAPLHPDRRAINSTGGRFFYLLDVPASPPITLGVGVVGAAPPKGDGVDLDGNGTAEQFAHCTTSEGISFGAWAGTPYQSDRLWSGYEYLGYDVETNCPG